MGVEPLQGFLSVHLLHLVVPLDHLQGLVPRKLHDRERIQPCPSHVRDRTVPKIVEPKILDPCPLDRISEAILDVL